MPLLRPPRPVRTAATTLAPLVVVALVAVGCAPDASGPSADGPTGGPAPEASATEVADGALVLVLPPSDGLAVVERARIRALVTRAVRARSGSTAALLEPATAAALADTLALAVRRAAPDGTVCLVGARGRTALGPLLARYPSIRSCLVPGPAPTGAPAERSGVGDVDLVRLGRELGTAARAAAGGGAVLLLDGGDPMLDVRWRRGVEEAVLGAAGAVGPGLGVVTTAAGAVALLDAQAALLADGIVPGGSDLGPPEERGDDAPVARDLLPSDDLVTAARALRPVTVVVLDAGAEAALLAPELAARGIRVVTPTSLLRSGGAAAADVVLHWSVRWDVALATALAPDTADGAPGPADGAPASGVDLLVLETGLAAAG